MTKTLLIIGPSGVQFKQEGLYPSCNLWTSSDGVTQIETPTGNIQIKLGDKHTAMLISVDAET